MRDPTIPKSKHQRKRYALTAILLLLSTALVSALVFLQLVPVALLLLCTGLIIGSFFCGHQALAHPFPGWAWMISITVMVLGCAGFMWLGVRWAADAMQMLLVAAWIVQGYRFCLLTNWTVQEFTTDEPPSGEPLAGEPPSGEPPTEKIPLRTA